MGSFGEDLRTERISRGIALEQISAVTKISRHLLVALEQEKFGSLPGGILSKGIVRGYTGALGLNQQVWTERFLQASAPSVQTPEEDDHGWMTFATNVGKARIMRRDAVDNRIRWIGALLLLFVVVVGGFLTVRYLGMRTGWWSTLLPPILQKAAHAIHSLFSAIHALLAHAISWITG
jgi:cytoskeletal protein RodZ